MALEREKAQHQKALDKVRELFAKQEENFRTIDGLHRQLADCRRMLAEWVAAHEDMAHESRREAERGGLTIAATREDADELHAPPHPPPRRRRRDR